LWVISCSKCWFFEIVEEKKTRTLDSLIPKFLNKNKNKNKNIKNLKIY
jgi:hypothetical protein